MLTEFIINLVSSLGYLGLYLAMLIEATSLPIPSEIIMGVAGFLVYKGEMNLFLAAFFAALGNITGSTLIYFIGAKGGRPIIKKYGKYLDFTEEKFDKVDAWFNGYGNKIIFFSQLLPIVRTFISLPAGILKVNFPRFMAYTFVGSFIWCLGLTWVSSLLGAEWEKLSDYLKQFEVVVIIGILALIAYFVLKRIYKWRKNRLNIDK